MDLPTRTNGSEDFTAAVTPGNFHFIIRSRLLRARKCHSLTRRRRVTFVGVVRVRRAAQRLPLLLPAVILVHVLGRIGIAGERVLREEGRDFCEMCSCTL